MMTPTLQALQWEIPIAVVFYFKLKNYKSYHDESLHYLFVGDAYTHLIYTNKLTLLKVRQQQKSYFTDM